MNKENAIKLWKMIQEAVDYTLGDAYTLLPFNNTIVELSMTGQELKMFLKMFWTTLFLLMALPVHIHMRRVYDGMSTPQKQRGIEFLT